MIIAAIKDSLTYFIENVGYWGVFLAMTIESCLIPLPSEITMSVAGFLVADGKMNMHVASFVGAAGNVVGSLMAYGIGYKIKESAILKFIRKWGKFILVSEHEYEKTRDWVKQYGSFVSFFSRLLPGVRTVISLPAGVARIPLIPFIVWTFLGSLLWSYILVWAGYALGENWETFDGFFKKFEIAIIVVCVLAVGLYVYKKLTEDKGERK